MSARADRAARIVAAYVARRLPLSAIAAAEGISAERVRQILDRAGVARRAPGATGRRHIPVYDIDGTRLGDTLAQAARTVGCTYQAIINASAPQADGSRRMTRRITQAGKGRAR